MTDKIKVGAVLYDPKVSIIWDMIHKFFEERGMEVEGVYFKDYDLQVDAVVNGDIDIAWNSPLAWLQTQIRTHGKSENGPMRDTDRDRKTICLVKKGSGIKSFEDLKGKKIGFGAFDSPQARLIPIYYLKTKGLEYGKDYEEVRFDKGVGLNGDHVGGELDAVKALEAGDVDCAFTIDLNFNAWSKDGTIDANALEVLGETPHFDHCIFSARVGFPSEDFKAWAKILLQMDYNDPEHKKIMDLEGLTEWVEGRTSGFEQITNADKYLDFFGKYRD